MPNLNISFTPASPAPANGYRVQYWNASTPNNVITVSPNPTGSPVTITGVAAGCYAGTIESVCSGGQFSSPISFNACSAASCLSGTTSATGNCASGQTSTFTLASGQQATVSMSGFYYSGSGTRTITGALLDNSNNVIQNFTYTQTGVGAGTTSPSNYVINTAGTYKLQVNQVNCSLNGSGTATMTVGNCQAVTPPPTYYYYTGILCGGSIQQSFRSTQSNLADQNKIVKALCSACGNTEQCFDNVSPTNTPNTNDVIAVYDDCSTCAGGGNGTISISNFGGSGAIIGDFSPTWFFIDTGTLPLQNLGTATGGHSGFTGNFGVEITGAIGGCLTLTVNNAIVDTIAISGSGTYTFLNASIPPNADVTISLDQGSCQ